MLEIKVSEKECRLIEQNKCIAEMTFSIEGEKVKLLTFSTDQTISDLNILDALTRAALNHAEHAGAQIAVCQDQKLGSLLVEFSGFKQIGDEFVLNDINAFFAKKCQHKVKRVNP